MWTRCLRKDLSWGKREKPGRVMTRVTKSNIIYRSEKNDKLKKEWINILAR